MTAAFRRLRKEDSLNDSIIFMRYDFRTDSLFSGVLVYSRLAVMGELGSDAVHVFWFLLLMILHLSFAIWISLVFDGLGNYLESTSFVPGLLRSPSRPEALAESDHLWGLPTSMFLPTWDQQEVSSVQ